MSRKTTIPTPISTGSKLMPKLVGTVGLLVVLVLVVKHPSEAAGWAKAAFGVVESMAEGIAGFIRQFL